MTVKADLCNRKARIAFSGIACIEVSAPAGYVGQQLVAAQQLLPVALGQTDRLVTCLGRLHSQAEEAQPEDLRCLWQAQRSVLLHSQRYVATSASCLVVRATALPNMGATGRCHQQVAFCMNGDVAEELLCTC